MRYTKTRDVCPSPCRQFYVTPVSFPSVFAYGLLPSYAMITSCHDSVYFADARAGDALSFFFTDRRRRDVCRALSIFRYVIAARHATRPPLTPLFAIRQPFQTPPPFHARSSFAFMLRQRGVYADARTEFIAIPLPTRQLFLHIHIYIDI